MWQALVNSLWFILFFAILLLLSIGAGILYAKRFKKRDKWESSGIESSIVGIFGLIISFTFLQAGNTHRERAANIHREANGIDMLYRYSKEMPDSFHQYTKNALLIFLKNQLDYERSNDQQFFYKSKKESDSYWSVLGAYKKQEKRSVNAALLDKIADCFDQIQTSVSIYAYSNYEQTPSFVVFRLAVVALLIGFLVGFMNAVKSGIHYLVPVIYFVMIALTMMVISDLNNPRLGLIKPSYYHLQMTYEYIRTAKQCG